MTQNASTGAMSHESVPVEGAGTSRSGRAEDEARPGLPAPGGLLASIRGPRDLDRLDHAQLKQLAREIREFLVSAVARTGGHLGPNLGVVETTIAVHRVFHSPHDPIVFDTGHQSYVHKLLTGRQDFTRLRQRGGLAGYPQRAESEHDIVESSHASSSLSWADGISRALTLRGQTDRTVVAMIGDGALTGGMVWEAINNISDANDRRLVIIVNDNGRSYAPTIGGMARYMNEIRTHAGYDRAYRASRRLFSRLGRPGRFLFNSVRGGLHGLLRSPSWQHGQDYALFSNLDIKYIGPVDGHDIRAMEIALRQAKRYGHPVIVHAITQKGRGYEPARADVADQFHAIGRIDPDTGRPISSVRAITWTAVFSDEMLAQARRRPDVVGITAAMRIPVGLDAMAQAFPDRVIDVGIAEEHAVASAAGLAFGGMHPVVAVYATFLNRAFDQVLMDVALHRAPVTFVLDRAGLTGPDGASHNGQWDLSTLQLVPGIRIAAPRDADTLREELAEALDHADGPTVLRYPKGAVAPPTPALTRTDDGVDVLCRHATRDVLIVAIGAMAGTALEVARSLHAQGVGTTVVDPRWVVPVPRSVVLAAASHRLVVTIEDGLRVGGIGTRIRQDMRDAGIDTGLTEFGLPDRFFEHATRDELLEEVGLDAPAITRQVLDMVLGLKVPKARPVGEEPFTAAPVCAPGESRLDGTGQPDTGSPAGVC